MKFFVYSCECNTPTDGVIFRGIYNLLNKIYPNSEFYNLPDNARWYRDANFISEENLHLDKKFDAIIVPGSPFLWHYYYDTFKIKNLLRIKQLHKCPVIWLGIGACLPYYGRDLFDKIHFEQTNKIFSGDLVIVRDSLAKSILDKSGIQSTHLVCPSYFSQDVHEKTKENLIVFYEPGIGLSYGDWQDKKKLENYYDIYREFSQNDCDVVVKDFEEIEFAEKIGLKGVRLLKDTDDTLNTVREYRNVLSGRVHIAIPSLISGANVGIIPIDTRYLTITNFVDCDINNKEELGKMKGLKRNLLDDFNQYVKLIKEVL